MTPTTSRRALLKGAPAVAIAAAIPVTANALPVDRSAWNAAMRAYEAAKAADEAFMPEWLAVSEKWKVERDSFPHIALRPDPHAGRKEPVSTADQFFVNRARKTVADIEAGKAYFENLPGLQNHVHLCRDLAAAADERDAQLQAIRDRLGLDAADEKAEALGDALWEARNKLIEMPAPDLAALRFKIDHFLADDGSESVSPWNTSYLEQTYADIARLLPEGA